MPFRTGPAIVALALLVLGLALLPDQSSPRPPADRGELSGGTGDGQPRQTSDGLPGEIAEPLPPGVVPRQRVTEDRSWRIAPGVRYRRLDETDRRGRYRVHVVTVNPAVDGVRLDYASLAKVPRRGPLTRLLRRDAAVAGVNGGFFDIDDTGAPLGVGRDRQRGFLHAAELTWTNAFTTSRAGGLRIGPVTMRADIAEHPEIDITNVNSPRVREGKVGVYTSDWGSTAGYSVTDGQTRNVHMLQIENDRVVARSTRLTSGEPITGTVLIGRGPGADQLAELPLGSRATVTSEIPSRYSFAISGETILLRDGLVEARDDVYLHPRTAVGIDRDSGRVLLVAVDGRQDFSRGLTLVELGRLMRRLGAEDALNLDGGGSTTVAGLSRSGGELQVLNSPSDGTERSIPDGIAVLVGQ